MRYLWIPLSLLVGASLTATARADRVAAPDSQTIYAAANMPPALGSPFDDIR